MMIWREDAAFFFIDAGYAFSPYAYVFADITLMPLISFAAAISLRFLSLSCHVIFFRFSFAIFSSLPPPLMAFAVIFFDFFRFFF